MYGLMTGVMLDVRVDAVSCDGDCLMYEVLQVQERSFQLPVLSLT